MEREVGWGIGMGSTCKPMAVSFQCMTKFTTNKKKKNTLKKKKKGEPHNKFVFKKFARRTSWWVQWLGLHALKAEGEVSVPGQGTKILQATQLAKNK